ncbi:MAG TPA: transglutaminase-like domain-containing protein [Candidatus Dormibacteraeota bacterium]|nr:transglutaminase-like domain-containing protein [Candidatus Dormibacteraeota bacterium]
MSIDTESVTSATGSAEAVAPPEPETGVESGDTEQPHAQDETRPPINPTLTTAGAMLASAAAAWVVGGIFRDFSAHLVGLLGVLIGGGIVLLTMRRPGGAYLQLLVIPAAALVGAVLVALDSHTGGGLTYQISQAVSGGGLLQPPIPFDPGWRFILVFVFALLTAGSAALGISLRRPRLGVSLAVPVAMAAVLTQPASSEVATVVVALLLLIVGMTLAYGAELGTSGLSSAAFESRRLVRGGAFAAGLAIAVLGLSQLGFLFPQPNTNHTIPPQRPQIPPLPVDQVLFSYTATRALPLRVGVIDVFDTKQQAWLLPPYDASTLHRFEAPGAVPGGKATPGADPIVFHIVVNGLTGHALPEVAFLDQVKDTHNALTLDPRTGALAIADEPIYKGLSYTLVGEPLPTGAQVAKAPKPGPSYDQFLAAPPPPIQVSQLLGQYSQLAAQKSIAENAYDKLSYLRQALYSNVVAAGAGAPGDMTAQRVGQMLGGGEANPYEIVEAEALLARWAGIPSRIGFGYFGGERQSDGSYAVHPSNGATWLETYFSGYGWYPITGTPPKAKPSTHQQQKNQVNAAATDQLQLIVYIPTRRLTALQLFQYVQWYLVRILPIVLGVVALYAMYPWFFKLARTRQRRRWGRRLGLHGRIAAAYAEFRDRARDLTIGDPAASPTRFLAHINDDAEHEELAWLVSRALWGDLRRDLRPEDADAAERLAASVARRLDRAQPMLNRVLARIARTSLREPYSTQMPNPWFEVSLRVDVRGRLRAWRTRRRRAAMLRPRRTALAAVSSGLLITLVTTCATVGASSAPVRTLPKNLVPHSIGAFSFKVETDASKEFARAGSDAEVSSGAVYTIHHGQATDGALELSVFKPDYTIDDINDESLSSTCQQDELQCVGHQIFRGIQCTFGSGYFHRLYVQGERAYTMVLPDQTIFLWFPPHTETMALMVLLGEFPVANANDLFRAVLDYQHHRTPQAVPVPVIQPGPHLQLNAGPTGPKLPTNPDCQ